MLGWSRKVIVRTVGLFVLAAVVSSCAATQKPPVPGLENQGITPPEIIPVSRVLASLNCQLTKGFLKIVDEKKKLLKVYPDIANFRFKEGTGVFSGSVKVLESDNASLNVVIPFSGSVGTNAKPDISGTLSSTGLHEVKRTFSIDTKVESLNLDICNYLKKRNIDVGDFIKNALVSAFKDTIEVRLQINKKPYKPIFKTKEIQFTTSFTVVRKISGGFSLNIVPRGPRIDSIGPSIAINSDRTDVYNVNVTLPLGVRNSTDARRIHFCVDNKEKRLCLEDPYTSNTWAVRLLQLDIDLPIGEYLTLKDIEKLIPKLQALSPEGISRFYALLQRTPKDRLEAQISTLEKLTLTEFKNIFEGTQPTYLGVPLGNGQKIDQKKPSSIFGREAGELRF